jgi:hypothetical protein
LNGTKIRAVWDGSSSRRQGTPVGEVAGVQEWQELQNEKIGIVARALFEAGCFPGRKMVRLSKWTEGLPCRGDRTQPRVSTWKR